MADYYCVKIKYTPEEEYISDLLADDLAACGYEMFENDPGELRAYVPADKYDEKVVGSVLDNLSGMGSFKSESEFIEGCDWNAEWEKNYFQPIVVDDKVVVHSTFHKDIPVAEYDIVIDPKMAFGTGHHSTTMLMMRYILETDMAGKSVIDMGCGTGILSILAKMHGAAEVTGIEIDRDAWENALDNAVLNKVDISLIHGDASALKEEKDVDYFFANINRNIILADMKEYVAKIKKGGCLFLSGFYLEDIDILMEEAQKYGLEKLEVKSDKNWAALKLQKK